MTSDFARDDESTIDRASSSLRADEAESLDAYRVKLKQSRVTPRQWLKDNPHLSSRSEFRLQLWCHYSLAYPLPRVPGFTIEDVLGEGGMGLVYLGRDNRLDRLVAIKELTDDLRDHAEFQARFRLEAKILAKLDHPNIVKIHQFLGDAGREFIAMEYVPDGSLIDRMHLPVDANVAAWLVAKLARAIDHAHAEKIIHRDLKPGNILFDRNEEPKISDFGLAKDLLALTDHTRGAALGTTHYMAPEQTDGKPPTPATDIWALGVILYRLLTGRMPFEGKNQGDIIVNIRTAAPAQMAAAVSPPLRAICLQCLQKSPDDRFQRAADLADALEKSAPPAARTPHRFGGRRHWRWAAAAAVAAVLLAAVFLVVMLLSPASGAPVLMKERHAGYCSSIAITPDGLRAISENGGGEIAIWDLKNGLKEKSLLHALEQPDKLQEVGGVIAVSPDGRYFAAAGVDSFPAASHILALYDQRTYERLNKGFATFSGGMAGAAAFSHDGSKLAVAEAPALFGIVKPNIVIVDVPGGKTKVVPVAAQVQSLAFSSDGTHLIAGGTDKTLRLWQVERFVKKADFLGHAGSVDHVRFSADGNRVYSASHGDDTLRVWEKGTAVEIKQIALRKIAAKLVCAAISPGGRAVTGHVDGQIRAWDLDTGNSVYQYRHADVPATAIAISSDGQSAVAALADHRVYLYRLPWPRDKQ